MLIINALAVTILLVWIGVRLLRRWPRRKKGVLHPLPPGERIYSDTDGEGSILKDNDWGLVGKPDEVWRNNDQLHIVEIKSSRLPSHQSSAYPNHRMQLAVYMRVAEAHFGQPVESGEIRYADGQRFVYPWNEPMKRELWQVLKRLRQVEATGRTYAKVTKNQCRMCRYYSVCEKKRYAR